MKTISLQRWIYVSGDSVPNALRALATELEKNNSYPDDEYIYDYSKDTIIEIAYCDEEDELFRAGICVSYKFED